MVTVSEQAVSQMTGHRLMPSNNNNNICRAHAKRSDHKSFVAASSVRECENWTKTMLRANKQTLNFRCWAPFEK